MDIVYSRVCGLDVHKKKIAACISVWESPRQHYREQATFGTMTQDLVRLAQWLRAHGVTHVGMESTGPYWKPVWNILEEEFQSEIQAGEFELVLANARHVKAIPGHKTDRKDGRRIADLLQHNLLPRSFVPARPIRRLRELTRYRTTLVQDRSRVASRMQKVLEESNIKLASVASDIFGVSGQEMLEQLASGVTDAGALADLALGQLRDKMEELQKALEGRLEPTQRYLIRRLLEHYRATDRKVGQFDLEIQRYAHRSGLDASIERWMEIPGIKQIAARVLVAELGTDMAQFETADRAASWAGVCPGNDESAGKRKSGRCPNGNRWLRSALLQVAWAAIKQKDSYFRAQYQRIAARRGKKRAALAVAHSILVIGFTMLKNGCRYQELGADYFFQLNAHALQRYYVHQLERMGLRVTLENLPGTA
jgi:transposase